MTQPNSDEEQLADAPPADVVDRIKERVREDQARKEK